MNNKATEGLVKTEKAEKKKRRKQRGTNKTVTEGEGKEQKSQTD